MTNFLVLSSDLLDEEPPYDAEAKVPPLPVGLCFESFLNKAGENKYTCKSVQASQDAAFCPVSLRVKREAPHCFCNRRSVGQLFLCCDHVSAFDVCQLRILKVNVSSKPQQFVFLNCEIYVVH